MEDKALSLEVIGLPANLHHSTLGWAIDRRHKTCDLNQDHDCGSTVRPSGFALHKEASP